MAKLIPNAIAKANRRVDEPVKIGNNRTLRRRRGSMEFALHGTVVAEADDFGDLWLSPDGYATATTRSAITEALNLFCKGVGSASFAGGQFTVRYEGETHSGRADVPLEDQMIIIRGGVDVGKLFPDRT